MSTRLPTLVQMLEALVAEPSVSSLNPAIDTPNRGVIDLLAAWMEALGFAVEVMPLPGDRGKYNLIASRGGGPDGFVLSGHTDTVPYEPGPWKSDPFRLTERDGALYGLGASDMKSFFAILVEALRKMDLAKLRSPLTVLATADEESSMLGARTLAQSGRFLGRHALIGEPTGLKPVRMHKGVMMEAIRLHGRSGHASNPALGVSALEGMHAVIGELLAWRQVLQTRYSDPLFEVAVPTVNLGHIHGGDNPNRICGECELQIDVRLLPGMAVDAVRAELRDRVGRVLEGSALSWEVASLLGAVPPLDTPPDADVVRLAERLTGRPSGTVAFATEGPYLRALGLDTVILGAGDIEVAHQPNEHVGLDRLGPMVSVVQRMVEHFCMRAA